MKKSRKTILSFLAALIAAACLPGAASAADWIPILPPDDAEAFATLSGTWTADTTVSPSDDRAFSATIEGAYDSGDATWHQYLNFAELDPATKEINLIQRIDLGSTQGTARVEDAPAIAPLGNGACIATGENQYGLYGVGGRLTLRCTDAVGQLQEVGTGLHPNGFSSSDGEWVTNPAMVNFQGQLYASWFEGGTSPQVLVAKWTGTTWQILQSVSAGTFGYYGRESELTVVDGNLVLTWHGDIYTDALRTRIVDPQSGQLYQFAQDFPSPDGLPMSLQSTSGLGDQLALAVHSSDSDSWEFEGTSIFSSTETGSWSQVGETGGPFGPDILSNNIKLSSSNGRLLALFAIPYEWHSNDYSEQGVGEDLAAAVWLPNAKRWDLLPPDGKPLNFDGWYGAAALGVVVTSKDVIGVWQEHPNGPYDNDPVLGSSFPLSAVPADIPKPGKQLPLPAAPAKKAASFARSKIKIRVSKRAISIRTTARLMAPDLGASTCKGRLSVTVRSKGKQISKKKFALKFKSGRCIADVRLKVAKRYRGRKISIRIAVASSSTLVASPTVVTKTL